MKFYYGCLCPAFNFCSGVWGGVLMCTERVTDLFSLAKTIVKILFAKFDQRDIGCVFGIVYRMCSNQR